MTTTTRRSPRSRRLHDNATVAITAAIKDIKSELEFMRRPRRRVGRYATVIIVALAVVACAIAARADDAKPPTEAPQQLASIQRNIMDIYENLTLQTERLQLLELELAAIQRRCAGIEPRPPVWSEPGQSK